MSVQKKSFVLMPPRLGVCQECATDHPPEDPHNQQSFYYRVKFQMEHGRAPTWADAMTHCDEPTQLAWKAELAKVGITVDPKRTK